MSKLLVTGAAGFIGANFIHYWHSANPDDTLVALDCLTYAGNRNNLHGALALTGLPLSKAPLPIRRWSKPYFASTQSIRWCTLLQRVMSIAR